MNSIRVNNTWYKLPEEEKMLASVLNHLDLVKKGIKAFIKLYALEDGAEIKLGTTFINASDIQINLNNNGEQVHNYNS